MEGRNPDRIAAFAFRASVQAEKDAASPRFIDANSNISKIQEDNPVGGGDAQTIRIFENPIKAEKCSKKTTRRCQSAC
jgi:hypothetical protein